MPGQSGNADFFSLSAIFKPKYVRAKQKLEACHRIGTFCTWV